MNGEFVSFVLGLVGFFIVVVAVCALLVIGSIVLLASGHLTAACLVALPVLAVTSWVCWARWAPIRRNDNNH